VSHISGKSRSNISSNHFFCNRFWRKTKDDRKRIEFVDQFFLLSNINFNKSLFTLVLQFM